jgi:biopolymer transport protein ExbD
MFCSVIVLKYHGAFYYSRRTQQINGREDKHGRCMVCQLARVFVPRHLNRWTASLIPEPAIINEVFMYHLKKMFVVSVSFLILCFGATLTFAQERAITDTDKPNFRDPRLLIVMIYPDGKLAINKLPIEGTACLRGKLLEIFDARLANGVFTDEMRDRDDIPDTERVAKAVWILASPNLSKESIATVVEALKLAGASPIKMLTDASYQKMLDEPPSPPEPLTQKVKRKVKVSGKKPKSK